MKSPADRRPTDVLSLLTMRMVVVLLASGVIIGAWGPASAEPDPFSAMKAIRATSPAPVPDVSFRGLDGGAARLESFRGRAILLTFFTTW